VSLNIPFQAPIFKHSDLEDPGLVLFNQWVTSVAQALNSLAGHGGPIPLNSDVNLQGNKITGAGAPVTPSDVVTLDYATKNYGAPAIQPMIQALGKSILQSYRRLNDQGQQENYSSFLNSILNTAPTANTGTLSASAGGGFAVVTVNAGFHQRVDGSQVPFASRTDSLPLPASFSITSLTRSGGVVTAVLGSTFTGPNGSQIGVGGPIPAEWQGVFIVTGGSGTNTITYNQGGGNTSTGSGGTLTLISTYYYTISRGQNMLGLVAAATADTWSARTAASFDGSTIIAVVVINYQGVDPINSAAGGTAPQTGASIPVVRRM
jgi:hypothetical protein